MKKLSALLLSAAVLTVLPGCNNEDWPEEKNNPEPTSTPSPAPTSNPNNGSSPGTGGSTPTTAPNANSVATSILGAAHSNASLAPFGYGTEELPDIAKVRFKLIDQFGMGISNQELTFTLEQSNPVGAELVVDSAITDAQGYAQAVVRSGDDFNLLRVRARFDGGAGLTLSNLSAPIMVSSSPTLDLRAGNGTGEGFVANQLGLALTNLAVGGQTQVSVNLVDGVADYRNFSTQVQFSSTCSAQGQPVVDQVVTFRLGNTLSGAELVNTTARTDNEGVAVAQLKAGLGNDLIRLVAAVDVDGIEIATQSSYQVSVSSGLPRDGWFSFATPVLNPGGIFSIVGTTVPWSILATDGYTGSAPLEGVQFKFFTNTGLLDFTDGLAQSGCKLVNGRCALTWINNIPMPEDGVVRALAYTHGVENFIDTNGNGMLDIGEYFCPLSEPFLALDDTGEYLEGAPFVDINNNGERDLEGRNNRCPPAITVAQAEANNDYYILASDEEDSIKYRGAACSEAARAAGHCEQLAVISRPLFFVTPDASLEITAKNGTEADTTSESVTLEFNVRDKNDNIPAAGTPFSVSCKKGSARILDVPNNSMPNMYSAPGSGYDFSVSFEFQDPEFDEDDQPITSTTSCEIKVGSASYVIGYIINGD